MSSIGCTGCALRGHDPCVRDGRMRHERISGPFQPVGNVEVLGGRRPGLGRVESGGIEPVGQVGQHRGMAATINDADGNYQGASISACGTWRYHLRRPANLIEDKGRLCYVMLNPSTADATKDDPTIRRCVNLAARDGYGEIVVVNLFAFRATDPAEMRRAFAADPARAIGPENDDYIRAAVAASARVCVAWGAVPRTLFGRAWRVVTMIDETATSTPLCLGVTANGWPRHPLMVARRRPFTSWGTV